MKTDPIDELTLSEEQLQLSVERLRLAFQTSPDSIIILRLDDGVFIDVNEGFVRQSGYAPAEAIGRSISEIGLWSDSQDRLGVLGELRSRGRVENHKVRFRLKSGRTRVVLLSAVLIQLRGESHVLAIARDIEDLERAQIQLRDSEALFKSVLRTAPVGIGMVCDRVFHWVSPPLCDLLGYTDTELIGHSTRMFYPDDREFVAVGDKLRAGIRECGVGRAETCWLRKDGTPLSILLSASALREGNPAAGLVFSAVDISAQKTAEAALRASEERTRLLLDTIQQGVLESDRDGRVVYSNPAAAKIMEKNRQELTGSFIWDLIPQPGSPEGVRRWFEQLWRERPTPHPIELTHPRRDGSEARTVVEWQFKHDGDGQPCGIVLLINDVSEKTRLEDRLRQAQKIEAVGQLAGGVAHDFNNLLTPIIGYSEMLLYSTPEGDPRHPQLSEVLKAAERARKLVQQLLAFGRKQMFEMKVLGLNQVLEGFWHILRQAIREDITLTIRPEAGLTRVRGDQSQIEVAVMNLVVNAQDAMPRGGQILIETANVAFDEDYCRSHPPSRPGAYVMLAISDTGEGMNAEVQRHLFEPFYTTKKMGRGTGLGLATVYGITKQHNGFIWTYSEVDRGTTFKIFLPSVDEPVEPETPDTPVTLTSRRGGETILLMEDNPMVCELVRTILVRAGYQVLTPAGIEACRQLFDQRHDTIDLLLSDVVMPVLSGPQLYRELVLQKPGLKVLYMSGYTEEIIASHGILDLGGQFIQKPITYHSLTAKVREVLDN